MLAVVKKPHIEIRTKGEIPRELVSFLKSEYGDQIEITDDQEDERVDILKTEWFQDRSNDCTPSEHLRLSRMDEGWTQKQLGEKLGKSRQYISDMENSRKTISKKVGLQLATLFGVGIDCFIQ